MIRSACQHDLRKKHGRDRKGNQRFRFLLCGHTWIEDQPKPLGDLRPPLDKGVTVLKMLLEGCSIRTVSRLTGVARNTIGDLLLLVGLRCNQFWMQFAKGIRCDEIQCDEVWLFIGCKEKVAMRLHKGPDCGDAYAFTSIDPNTKVLIA
jgi:hypothetical protein